jgi:hypothetical protein
MVCSSTRTDVDPAPVFLHVLHSHLHRLGVPLPRADRSPVMPMGHRSVFRGYTVVPVVPIVLLCCSTRRRKGLRAIMHASFSPSVSFHLRLHQVRLPYTLSIPTCHRGAPRNLPARRTDGCQLAAVRTCRSRRRGTQHYPASHAQTHERFLRLLEVTAVLVHALLEVNAHRSRLQLRVHAQ